MKILIVSPYLPHPQAGHGTGVFMFELARRLNLHHQVSLISFCDKREQGLAGDLKDLFVGLHLIPRQRGWQESPLLTLSLLFVRLFQVMQSVILWQPYYVSKYHHRQMGRAIRRHTKQNQYDIVQFELAYMGQYRKYVHGGKTILHEHDVAYRPAYREYKNARSLPARILKFLEWCRWALYEARIVRRFDHVFTVTDQDRRLLQWLTGMKHISYLPRGVDVPDHIPEYETREPETLLFIGTFSHRPNLDAAMFLCKEIFPLVLQQFPRAILYIIGSNPTHSLQELAKQNPGIKILGFVEDVEAYFQRCSVFIAPLRLGGGVKIKVLHAMAHGIPVVTTKIGAEGIEGIGQNNILIANTAQGLAEHVWRLFRDRELASAVGRKGYETVKHRYSWDSVLSRLENIYGDVAGRSENKI